MPTDSAPTNMEAALGELRRRHEQALALGGPERVARQHARGLLTARERIDLLLDPGFCFECGPTAGFGRVYGRLMAYHATDATVKGGAEGATRGRMVQRIAARAALPFVDLTQGGGAATTGAYGIMTSRMAGIGGNTIGAAIARPRRNLRLTAVLGNYYAPWNVPLSDFAVMTKRSYFAIASPPVIKDAIGEAITELELGGWEVQSRVSGQIDAVGEDDPDAIRLLREVFSYLPGNVFQEPPIKWSGDPVGRRDEALLTLVPDRLDRGYDMRRVIKCIVDDGAFLELKPGYGRSLITCLARMAGYPVAIVASQPLYQAGAIDHEGAVKAKRVTQMCSAFHIPMVFFQDVPGFLIGGHQEHNRILAKGMEYMTARIEADVPKISIVVRKSYGLAYFAMSGSGPGRCFTFAWPSARIAFMGPEAAARVTYRRELEQAADFKALLEKLAAPWHRTAEPWLGTKLGYMDDIIDPRDTRPVIIRALEVALGPEKTTRRRWPPR